MDKQFKITKDDVEIVLGWVDLYNEMSKDLSLFVGSKIKSLIIFCLVNSEKSLTKMDIHNLITDAGIKINYKNTSQNIDDLSKAEIVKLTKGPRYNQTFVTLIKKSIPDYFKEAKECFGNMENLFKKGFGAFE